MGPSLGQPKIFRCGSLCCCVGDCVVGHCHLYPLHSWQDILLTFAQMELDSTTMFPSGTNVMFIRSTEEPVLVQVIGHSEHGDAYRRITYDRDGKTALHNRASVRRLSLLQFLCLQMCVYGGGVVPHGGGGTVTWQPSPKGCWGTVFPGVGNDKGGGGTHITAKKIYDVTIFHTRLPQNNLHDVTFFFTNVYHKKTNYTTSQFFPMTLPQGRI